MGEEGMEGVSGDGKNKIRKKFGLRRSTSIRQQMLSALGLFLLQPVSPLLRALGWVWESSRGRWGAPGLRSPSSQPWQPLYSLLCPGLSLLTVPTLAAPRSCRPLCPCPGGHPRGRAPPSQRPADLPRVVERHPDACSPVSTSATVRFPTNFIYLQITHPDGSCLTIRLCPGRGPLPGRLPQAAPGAAPCTAPV